MLLFSPVETLILHKIHVALGRKNASGCWLAIHLKEEERWAPVTMLDHSLHPVALQ